MLPTDLFIRRVLIVAAVALGALAVVGLVVYTSQILLVLFAGMLLARLLAGPARTLSERTPLPHVAALLVVTIGLVAALVGLFAYLTPQVSAQLAELTDEMGSAWRHLYDRIESTQIGNRLLEAARERSGAISRELDLLAWTGRVASTSLGVATGLAIVLFVGIYLAAAPQLYARGVLALVPRARHGDARRVLEEVSDTLWWWLVGRLASMAIIGVLTTVGLWALGIPVPIALGLLAALLTFIPNFGPLIALIPPTMLALRQGTTHALAVVVLYLVIQTVESYVVTPLIQQRNVELPPVVTIGAQVVLGSLAGVLGLALATPLAAVTLTLFRELHSVAAETDGSSSRPASPSRSRPAPATAE